MANTEYQVEVVTREAVTIVGVYIDTNMNDSALACPRLWSEVFGPRMEEIPTFAGDSYGVSVMGSGDAFTYWAGLVHVPGQPIPKGMSTLDLPGGLYACCHLTGLPGLALVYKYFYHVWGPGSDYEFILDSPCYELYPANHMQTGRLSLYMPVRPKIEN